MSRTVSVIAKRDLIYTRDVIRSLVARDLRGRYKNSVLGMLWSILTPLLYVLVFFFLFRLVISLDIRRYSSFAFTGLIVWGWFQSSLNQAVLVIKSNHNLVGQPGFPVATLPVVSVTSNFVHFLVALPALLLMLAIEGAHPNLMLLTLPALIAVQFALTLSLAYLVASINVRFQDAQHILAFLLQLFFFVTPIFYDPEIVPEQYRIIYYSNPVAHLVNGYRQVLMHGSMPDWEALGWIGVLSAGLLLLGYRVFRQSSYRFLEAL